MFEQAVINPPKNRWSVALSFTVQSAIAGAVLLASILTIERLPAVDLPVPLPPLPAAPRAVEIVATSRATTASTAPVQPRAFTAPSRIPRTLPTIVDNGPPAPPPLPLSGLTGTGLPPGLYSATPLQTQEQMRTVPPPFVKEEQTPPATRMIKVGGHVMEAKIIHRVMPVYPKLARDMRISGLVRLVGIIGRDGTVRELKVSEGHPLLVNAAVSAVRQWLYSPTLLNGEPVEVIAPIEVRFTLAQ